MGVAAANQRVTNMKHTIVGFKRLLGRMYNDPYVQRELLYLPFHVVPNQDGSLGIKVCKVYGPQVSNESMGKRYAMTATNSALSPVIKLPI